MSLRLCSLKLAMWDLLILHLSSSLCLNKFFTSLILQCIICRTLITRPHFKIVQRCYSCYHSGGPAVILSLRPGAAGATQEEARNFVLHDVHLFLLKVSEGNTLIWLLLWVHMTYASSGVSFTLRNVYIWICDSEWLTWNLGWCENSNIVLPVSVIQTVGMPLTSCSSGSTFLLPLALSRNCWQKKRKKTFTLWAKSEQDGLC